MKPIEILRKYVEKQSALVNILVSGLDGNIDDLNFKALLPRAIEALGAEWQLTPHGVGVLFRNVRTGEVIDAHVGFLESPDIFDAWRIEGYVRSLKQEDVAPGHWARILEQLARDGWVTPYPGYANHYVLT